MKRAGYLLGFRVYKGEGLGFRAGFGLGVEGLGFGFFFTLLGASKAAGLGFSVLGRGF